MKKFFSFALVLFAACSSPTTEELTQEELNIDAEALPLCRVVTQSPDLPAGDVLSLAEEDEQESHMHFAKSKGAEIVPVDEEKSFAVWWEPENFDITTGTVLVSLHGHGTWATRGFEAWYPELSERGYAFLGLQWWFGRSLENEGYYEPDRIYSLIVQQLEEKDIPPGNVIFEGFSMGSARSYAVSMYDHECSQEPYFGVSIANAGPWEDDYPLYSDVLAGDYGDYPLNGTKWILFCGEKDYNDEGRHQGLVCEGMEHTEEVIQNLGGSVELFLRDPEGDHGSLNINPKNSSQVLDKAETLLTEF